MLAYTLAPHRTYPGQLQQAVNLLSHLLNEEGLSPENIAIGGDSAGANLCLGILSHILHPHPLIPPLKLSEGKSLAAVILMCPWVSFDMKRWASVRRNALKDCLSIPMNDDWSASFLGGAPIDAYNEPLCLSADDPWWQGLDRVVENVLILAGEDEILLDSILEMRDRLDVSLENRSNYQHHIC